MTKHGTTRHGSLQFYPRKRANKILPSVNWNSISDKKIRGMLGFICYKVGMKSAYVRDNLSTSLTKGQRITIPVTIVECPPLKILSVRFYKNNNVTGEILNQNLDKEVKKKIKTPKHFSKKIEDFKKDYDDIKLIVYSQAKKTGIKKNPDFMEVGLAGNTEDKLNFVKENLAKELTIKDFLTEDLMKDGLLDIRGVTKGKGTQGAAKRFGLTLRAHKSEKGVRGPGSGGPWHPTRVEFTQPMMGQMGYFTRVIFNNKIIETGNIREKNINPSQGFKKYGRINNDYIIISGSIQGPSKRQLILTPAYRPNKNQSKKNFEFLELR